MEPTKEPTKDPSVEPSPDDPAVRETGLWEACADGYCLDGRPLVLDALDGGTDLDGDGRIEARTGELAGLVGLPVVLEVDKISGAWLVRSVRLV